MKTILFIAVLLLLSCSQKQSTPPVAPPNIPMALTIPSSSFLTWYRDSACTDPIFPPSFRVQCPAGSGPCLYIHTGQGFDYTCTALPDTMWGTAEYTSSYAPTESLYCIGDTCKVLHDTIVYSIREYREWRSNAICSDSAASYTQYGLCYSPAPSEDTIRVWNPLFSLTFYAGAAFCLAKIPLPLGTAAQGVFIYSSAYQDTIFCPAALINSTDDYINRAAILNYSSKSE